MVLSRDRARRWTPHPLIATIRDNKDSSGVLFFPLYPPLPIIVVIITVIIIVRIRIAVAMRAIIITIEHYTTITGWGGRIPSQVKPHKLLSLSAQNGIPSGPFQPKELIPRLGDSFWGTPALTNSIFNLWCTPLKSVACRFGKSSLVRLPR